MITTVIGVLILLLVIGGYFIFSFVNRPLGIDEIWKLKSEQKLETGKTVVVHGNIVLQPDSDFRFNAIYLLDEDAPDTFRTPVNGFWFGLRIDGASCVQATNPNQYTCEPFDPGLTGPFEFKGTIHFKSVGKKEIMWLSDIDYESSRRWINGEWHKIPLGKFVLVLEKD